MTKERLRRYGDIEKQRRQIKALLAGMEERERELWSAVTSTVGKTGDMPKSSVNGDKMSLYMARREKLSQERQELIRRYYTILDELDAEQLAIENAVATLPEREQLAVRAHYLEGLTWEKVCVRMDLSWRQVHRIHSHALTLLENM